MTEAANVNRELKNPGYEIFIGSVSMLSIVNLVLIYAVSDENLSQVLRAMNFLLSLILISDFTYRLLTAPAKGDYVFRQYGWADLLASLPVPQLKILRLFRLARVYRLQRHHGIKDIGRSLVKDRAGSALFSLLLLGILVLEFGSFEMLNIEEGAKGANITSASDSLWYVIVTISTVGYGDRYPVTTAGRVLGAVIIVVGVGIFGAFTGYLANFFLSPARKELATEVGTPGGARSKVAELQALLSQQQAATAEIERLLASPEA